MDFCEFIKQLLKKKGWSYERFAEEINLVKEKAGLPGKIRKQNICNYLNKIDKKHYLGVRQLTLWEKALNLPDDVLCNMVEQTKAKKTEEKIREYKERIRNVR